MSGFPKLYRNKQSLPALLPPTMMGSSTAKPLDGAVGGEVGCSLLVSMEVGKFPLKISLSTSRRGMYRAAAVGEADRNRSREFTNPIAFEKHVSTYAHIVRQHKWVGWKILPWPPLTLPSRLRTGYGCEWLCCSLTWGFLDTVQPASDVNHAYE
jgi:hypothetical protein